MPDYWHHGHMRITPPPDGTFLSGDQKRITAIQWEGGDDINGCT